MRPKSVATACLLLSALLASAQTDGKPYAEGRIAGIVLDQLGQPLQHIFVHAVLEKTGMYMPTAESDAVGRFVVDGLEPGAYQLFGESDAAAYPNTAFSFYSKEEPLRVVLGNGGTVPVVLVLGPVAGVLSGSVTDLATGKVIVLRHALRFIVKKVSNPEESIEFDGPANFRWLITPGVEVTLEVTAEGYKSWSYADQSNLKGLPLRLESGEERTLKIVLGREARRSHR